MTITETLKDEELIVTIRDRPCAWRECKAVLQSGEEGLDWHRLIVEPEDIRGFEIEAQLCPAHTDELRRLLKPRKQYEKAQTQTRTLIEKEKH
jgi:hypothetical protein